MDKCFYSFLFCYFLLLYDKKVAKNSLICDFLCIFAVNWLLVICFPKETLSSHLRNKENKTIKNKNKKVMAALGTIRKEVSFWYVLSVSASSHSSLRKLSVLVILQRTTNVSKSVRCMVRKSMCRNSRSSLMSTPK